MPPTTGDLKIPMLTLHTLGDLFVPFLMEQVYAQRVADQRPRICWCSAPRGTSVTAASPPSELVAAFVDLVAWVETGVKPAGDDVLDPAAVAAPPFGCAFTDQNAPRPWNSPAWVFPKPAACSV